MIDTNVISLRRRKPPNDPPRMSLRDTIINEIEIFASSASCQSVSESLHPPHNYAAGWLDALVCTLADAGMPFETWKDELSAEALAGLDAMRIDLHPDEE